jgi:hypothetical protein
MKNDVNATTVHRPKHRLDGGGPDKAGGGGPRVRVQYTLSTTAVSFETPLPVPVSGIKTKHSSMDTTTNHCPKQRLDGGPDKGRDEASSDYRNAVCLAPATTVPLVSSAPEYLIEIKKTSAIIPLPMNKTINRCPKHRGDGDECSCVHDAVEKSVEHAVHFLLGSSGLSVLASTAADAKQVNNHSNPALFQRSTTVFFIRCNNRCKDSMDGPNDSSVEVCRVEKLPWGTPRGTNGAGTAACALAARTTVARKLGLPFPTVDGVVGSVQKCTGGLEVNRVGPSVDIEPCNKTLLLRQFFQKTKRARKKDKTTLNSIVAVPDSMGIEVANEWHGETAGGKRKRTTRAGGQGVVCLFVRWMFLLVCGCWFEGVMGLEVLPNGDGTAYTPGGGLRKVVQDWIAGTGNVEAKYGHIRDWDVSHITNFQHLFYGMTTGNPDISKWNTGAVTNMNASKFFID